MHVLPPQTPRSPSHPAQSPSYYASPGGSSSGSLSEREQVLLEEVYTLRQELCNARLQLALTRMSHAWSILHDATKAKNAEASQRLLAALDELGLASLSDLTAMSKEQARELSAHLKPVQATQFLSLFAAGGGGLELEQPG